MAFKGISQHSACADITEIDSGLVQTEGRTSPFYKFGGPRVKHTKVL